MTSVLHAHCRHQFTENRRERGSGVLLGEMETHVQIQGGHSHFYHLQFSSIKSAGVLAGRRIVVEGVVWGVEYWLIKVPSRVRKSSSLRYSPVSPY